MHSWRGESVLSLSEHKLAVLDAAFAAGEDVSPTFGRAKLYVEDDGKGAAHIYVTPGKGGSLGSAKVALEAAGFTARLGMRGSRDRLTVRRIAH